MSGTKIQSFKSFLIIAMLKEMFSEKIFIWINVVQTHFSKKLDYLPENLKLLFLCAKLNLNLTKKNKSDFKPPENFISKHSSHFKQFKFCKKNYLTCNI